MQNAPIPSNEEERLLSLHALGLLDTKPEERFDRITRTATKIFHAPISTLTLIDSKREWFKSCEGLSKREGDRAISFCGHALLSNDIFVIPDTAKDKRFADNPMVVDKPFIRFYAGVPIINADGQRIGVFCIKDTQPRTFSKADEEVLSSLAAWAELEINSHNLSIALTEIEEAQAKERAMLESVGDGFVVVDETGKIVQMNNAAGRLLEIDPASYIGKQYSKTWLVKNEKGENVPLRDQPIQIALTTGRTVSTTLSSPTYYYVRSNGALFPVALTVTPVILHEQIIGAIDVFRDITKDKEIDRAKNEFVSLASHQLRTPPTSMRWYLEMLRSGEIGPLNEKQKEYVDEVFRSNQRMITLVNALLSVSRIELGVFAVEPEQTDIGDLIHGVLSEMSPEIERKQLNVKKTISKRLHSLSVDPQLMQIAIHNIISNAVKYTPPKGHITIEALIAKQGEKIGKNVIQKNSLVIIVSDTGYGIPKDQQANVFTKLFRADNAKERDTEGTGLGLYLTKSIIEHVQGHIWFESVINRGSTFYLTIPVSGMTKRTGTTKLTMDLSS